MNNREYFINFINSHFGAYRADILKDKPQNIFIYTDTNPTALLKSYKEKMMDT